MSKGTIQVHTENIFPIIKKFLYSDHEIFLRELVSNAVDATQKLKALSSMGEFKGELNNLTIEVLLDKEAKTLTIRDHGIGMTGEEVEKYITQIAFSGAEEFVQHYKEKSDAQLIGHFGLGFYSSFMVSSSVEVISKSYKEDSKPVRWECDGSPDYTMEEVEKQERGTDIILHIAEDSIEFLEELRIKTLLKKYCKFLPVEIKFGTDIINNTQPAWTKKPSSLVENDYTLFYRELYPFADDPLFHIHLNVDYPFNLTGILYFPKFKNNFEQQKDRIQLYSNQVFVTDAVENIVPDFLMLMKGVIDSPDIPLNVSRSYLQSDASVKKISAHISKKVAEKLEELFKSDREDFEKKWDDVKVFIQYGMLSDDKFYERAKNFCLLKTTDGKYYTLDEFAVKIKPLQTDKNGKVVYLYTSDAVQQHSYVAAAKERGFEVLQMDSPVDAHFIGMLEQKLEETTFARVDADIIDKLIDKDEAMPSKLSKEQEEVLRQMIEKITDKEKFAIAFESLNEKEAPMLITRDEYTRRMREMSSMGGMNFMGDLKDRYNLVINANHPLISKVLLETDGLKQHQLIRQSLDLAMLSQNLLKGEELTGFINRSLELMS
ncbi:MAG: molecular chaperone HtpG [Chitinophagaceae bacterium]|nr:molecular chaperone HtpG [Chitinophagaceae bacterium]